MSLSPLLRSQSSNNYSQMGVTVRTVAMKNPGSQDPRQKGVRKPRATLMDLPLPRTGRYLQNWRKKFVPLLLSWAGSQADPFGTNGRIDSAVTSVWKRVYPDISIDDAQKDTVVVVVSLLLVIESRALIQSLC